ncbi:MAG: RDD family protein [Hyphomonas sp.]|nr:RDD family protein [Hyphomonas sp.]
MTDAAVPPPTAVEEGKRRRARIRAREAEQKRIRTLVTPEGAALNLKISTFGERLGAFVLDVSLQFIIMFAIIFAIAFVAGAMNFNGWQIAWAVAMVLIFFVRNFYFIFFEVGRKAATPGKRALGLRVADRKGGRLTANAVIARNFMRELEFFLPLSVLFSFGADGVEGWINWLLLIWCGIFVLFPLFNREKLRIGDLVAGTMVIHAPKVQLLDDIASAAPKDEVTSAIVFTPVQLDVYGIHELHVLEDVLRQSTPEIKRNVANRIATKIGYTPQAGETDVAFLEAFYAALRRHLEQRMLFGQRKEDKYDQR